MNIILRTIAGDFITGFQFLTRIRIVHQSEWSPESFGRSVKFFPIIGSIIGLILAAIVYGIQHYCGLRLPIHVVASLLILIEILLTGGLHNDGLMDTMDGIFSGRSRERMLEIMKDSRVGAYGVIAFCLLVLMKFSLLLDIEATRLSLAVLVMPIAGRTAIVLAITLFPYARVDGLGKTFSQYTNRNTLYVAGVFAVILLIPLGKMAISSGVIGIVGSLAFAAYVSKRLGGLTGDVYGAVSELTEIVALLVFVY
jgi:adenosylcobinamide-GDP ribazoletransferase